MNQTRAAGGCPVVEDVVLDCGALLTAIAVNLFLVECHLQKDSPAFQYLALIRRDLAEAHFLICSGVGPAVDG